MLKILTHYFSRVVCKTQCELIIMDFTEFYSICRAWLELGVPKVGTLDGCLRPMKYLENIFF